VMQEHPKTVRLVLSGHADKELILKCIGSTHQFLSKPCDPETLKSTMLRASVTDSALGSETLKRLVGQMSQLPSIPSLYSELVEVLQDPNASVESVGAIIEKDIAMTAQILKLVNSAFFGLRRRVSSAVEAANYLGFDIIRSLVLSINAFSQFDSVNFPGFAMASLWTHSVATGAAAKAVAQYAAEDPKLADEAFVSGLLHDTGKLVLAANFGREYGEVLKLVEVENLDQCAAEQRVFGANHADVGGYLLGLWGLPVPVVEAIAFHHSPIKAAENKFSPLTAVHIGNAFAHQDAQTSSAAVSTEYLSKLGIAGHYDLWCERLKKQLTPEAA
jgi:HD-like signal output (HDOD) protein